jgi:hypothetical protein
MICPNCHADVQGTWIDEGIGTYEYWGAKCVDKRMAFVCEECDEPLESEMTYEEAMNEDASDYAIENYRDEMGY